MEKIGLLYHYIIPNLIVISLSLLMIKKWGITSGATFVSACLLYICLFILKDKNHYSVFFILIFNFLLLLPVTGFIILSLKRQNNIILLKEWKIWIPVVAGLFSSIIIYILYHDGIDFMLITLVIAPIFESLLFHEIVFNTIKDRFPKKKELLILFSLSFTIAALHGSFKLKDLLFRTSGFFVLYLIKNEKRENSNFWIIISIHFLVNFICLIFDLLKLKQ